MSDQLASFSITYRWKYDVFLSFHGKDTRLGFIGYLRESFRQRGIHVFIDDEFIRTGEEITPALLEAIEGSRIAIIVFSKNYANSTFCLQELEKILACFKGEGRLIYPVFYYVDPSELRRPRGSYAEALARLDERFKDNKQKVKKWRLALSEVANLKGCHLQPKIAKEQEYITKIISEVSARINHKPLHVAHYPVGLVSRVKEVISLLDLWSTEETKMVGIWGIGGIGKSTIARAVYNLIADHFEGICFLSNVRKESNMSNGLSHLQEKLLRKLVMEKDLKLDDFHEGIPIIEHRLSKKKILLILDDVEKLEQLRALAGRRDWFGLGSRIIITTRNKRLLISHGVKTIYDVKELNDEEALELISKNASKKGNTDSDYIDVLARATHYSCGLPLALEVIGSNLCDKSVDDWSSALDEYERIPNEEIFEVLKLSYHALEELEKEVFLDLACFFNGENLEVVKNMLFIIRGFDPKYAIGVLVDKSLTKIQEDRVIMHDLIEDMGKEIVRQQSPKVFGQRDRLWFYEDFLHVLQTSTGTDKIEVIIIDMPKDKEIQWSGNAFKKMKNLKVLVIKNANFSQELEYLPNSLCVLELKGYPGKIFPSNFHSMKLVHLDLSCSSIESLPSFNKNFKSLCRMNFRSCKFLEEIPDMSGVSNLIELRLDGCVNLTKIHDSVGLLDKLKEWSVMRCKNLRTLPSHIKLPSLEHLNLFGCSSLKCFPEIMDKMEKLRTLDLDRTAITGLPSSIHNLIGLEILNMEECPGLKELPAGIYMLPKLWSLTANFCTGMKHFNMCGVGEEASLDYYSPKSLQLKHFCFSNCNLSDDALDLSLSYFPNMIRLDLSHNNFTTLPECIRECHQLKYLSLDNCMQLQHILEMPPDLEKFSAICCTSLTKSSKNRVLKEAHNFEPGKRKFILPRKEIPEWLDNYSRGSSISFWIQNELPTIFLWFLVENDQDSLYSCVISVHINDIKIDISAEWLLELTLMKTNHIYICDLQSIISHETELPLVKTWNRVKVSIERNTPETDSEKGIYFAIHVYKQQTNSKNIVRFMDPNTYVDCNSWQRVQQEDWEELEDEMNGDSYSVIKNTGHYQALHNNNVMAQRAGSAPFIDGWSTYDVFLSFYRSEDICSNFVDYLYVSLYERGFRIFMDDESMRYVEEITPSLSKAIQESKITIIVLSKNYVSSTFCLDVLVKILEGFKEDGRLIYPVFYNVDPNELEYQTGSYQKVWDDLERIARSARVAIWKKALSKVSNIEKGWHLNHPRSIANGKEKVEDIIRVVCARITRTPPPPLHVTKYSVGFVSQVQQVISLLDVGSNQEVKMIGICGTCGIGKSTIAQAVYNSVAHHFDESRFLSNLRELSDSHGLIRFEEKLGKKILVILDDVDKLEQLQILSWLRHGSRFIIMARDKQVLVKHGTKIIYDVKKLSDEEALQLLSWNAFKKENVDVGYMNVSKRAISYAGGLPLALEVIGSYLHGKTVDEWNSALCKLEKHPMETFLYNRHFKNVEEWLEESVFLEEKEPPVIDHSLKEKVIEREHFKEEGRLAILEEQEPPFIDHSSMEKVTERKSTSNKKVDWRFWRI